MHTVIETPTFLRKALEAGMSEMERFELVSSLGEEPALGDLIKGTGGVRKVRFGGKGKGKSGAYRAITFYSSTSLPVFLLTVYAKGAKVNLTKAECNALGKLCERLESTYASKVVQLSSRAG